MNDSGKPEIWRLKKFPTILFLAEEEYVESSRPSQLTPLTPPRRTAGRLHFFRSAAIVLFAVPALLRAGDAVKISPTMHSFMHDMPRTIRADHPAIVPVANAIRAVTTNPLQQLVMVNDVTHLLVDYDDDLRVYGQPEYFATLDEMIAKRREEGWLYLRDDCDGRAVFAAHLLASLGLPWRLEASFWKRHAWVVARVGGVDYDLIDFHPGTAMPTRLSYRLIGRWFVHASRQPPPFDWRRAWAERTQHDLLIGLQLGLLTLDSTPEHFRQRHSTDWTEVSPGEPCSPLDPRVLTTALAGFPYGETLRIGQIAAARSSLPSGSPATNPRSPISAELAPSLATNGSRESGEPAPARR